MPPLVILKKSIFFRKKISHVLRTLAISVAFYGNFFMIQSFQIQTFCPDNWQMNVKRRNVDRDDFPSTLQKRAEKNTQGFFRFQV